MSLHYSFSSVRNLLAFRTASQVGIRQHTRPQGYGSCCCQAGKPSDANGLSRRALQSELLASLLLCQSSAAYGGATASDDYNILQDTPLDLTVTDKVFLKVGLCPEGLRQDRALGDASAFCTDATPLGEIKLGLYGHLVPQTVANFLKAVEAGIYTGTLWSKVLPGEYIQAGQQGSRRTGAVDFQKPGQVLSRNQEALSSNAFRLRHKPGSISMSIGANNDDSELRQRPGYRNTEFLITTGPAPAMSLDGENIVFGKVLEGFDTMSAITAVPTFKPYNERVMSFNKLASFLKDDRADRVRAKWGKPLKSIVITDAGLM